MCVYIYIYICSIDICADKLGAARAPDPRIRPKKQHSKVVREVDETQSSKRAGKTSRIRISTFYFRFLRKSDREGISFLFLLRRIIFQMRRFMFIAFRLLRRFDREGCRQAGRREGAGRRRAQGRQKTTMV